MTNTMQVDQLNQQAIELRRAGKSRREIMQILGVGHSILDRALRGVPPPTWTLRPRAKDDLHAKARALRARGYTYAEIVAELGVSKGTVSLWVRDMPRVGRASEDEIRGRKIEGSARYWAAEGLRREALRQAMIGAAAGEIGPLSDREMVIAGAVAYWCEGAKSKIYRRKDQVTFINSDAGLIRLFLRFAELAGVSTDQLVCHLHIHETGDVGLALKYWRDVTGLGRERFGRPIIKRHNPKTTRRNIGADYHGCLAIRIRRSSALYRQIEGWASGIMGSAAARNPPDLLPREDLNLNCRDQNPKSCPLDDAGMRKPGISLAGR